MAEVVLGIGASHSPMINSTLEEWVAMKARQDEMGYLDREGRPATYDELVREAGGQYDAELKPGTLVARYEGVQTALDKLAVTIREASLDALIVIADDQRELFLDDNLPALLVYCGQRIKNEKCPLSMRMVKRLHDGLRIPYESLLAEADKSCTNILVAGARCLAIDGVTWALVVQHVPIAGPACQSPIVVRATSS